MKRFSIYFILAVLGLSSCEKFFDPDQDIVLKEDNFFKDWYDYRSAELGLYGLQQELAEQLLILGELRGDLLETTGDASRELKEVNNFTITTSNRYASPQGFYKLIAACNNLQRVLEHYHPEVLDPETNITNYDRLYGEVILMRSWAYFNAVRIYRSIPWIPVSLTSIEEITDFVNSPQTVMDSFDIIYSKDGYYNDTIWYDEPRELENAYLELPAIVDSCLKQIETGVKAVGVNHYINNNDDTWEVTIWSDWSKYYLVGQMNLYKGDFYQAMKSFNRILTYVDIEANDVRYGLDNTFMTGRWKNMHSSINNNEHIFVMWFGKSHRQTNEFQRLFSVVPPNRYELKPTPIAVHMWETLWNGWLYDPRFLDRPQDRRLRPGCEGVPGDFWRGYGVSYNYILDEIPVDPTKIREMLFLKMQENDFEVKKMMEGIDTVVYKYTLGREYDPYASDANFIIARAASVHLYAAEINTYYATKSFGDTVVALYDAALGYLNNGTYQGNGAQLGVRGRVGFADGPEAISTSSEYFFEHDPFTNKVTGYYYWYDDDQAKQEYIEDEVLNERARELAFEGERFYDLIRVAQRRGDNSYLADRVAAKFKGSEAERIRTLLMDENNWYIPFLLTDEE